MLHLLQLTCLYTKKRAKGGVEYGSSKEENVKG